MEIKQGDKVRVSRDIPQFYLEYNSYRMFEIEHRVVDVNMEDGFALLDSIPPKFTTILPTKYLVKVDAEAKEANVKIGDKVIVHYPSGDRIGSIQEIMLDGTYDIDYGGGCTGHNITRSQIEPYVAPKIKVGDFAYHQNTKVKIAAIYDNGDVVAYTYDNYRLIGRECDFEPYTEPTEQTEAEKKPNVGSIKIPVEVDLTDIYWDAYAADLAKELSVVYAKQGIDPIEAVGKAKEIIKQLKQNK